MMTENNGLKRPMTSAASCLDDRVSAAAVPTWDANGRFDGASTLVVDYGIKAATVTRRSEHR
jgi:hypothetical protein